MKLDKHVVDMFTELTKPADDVKMEKTCYGTISVVDGTRYVKLDGSDLLVPAASTVKTSHGDRVTVLMKNHSLTVTGNLTAPATDGEGGSSGEAGTAATIEVGTVTTGEAGSSASVTNSGTTSAAVFDFVIPKGDKGDKGDTGPQGPQGEKGDTGTWDGTIPDHNHTTSDITDFPTSLPANGGNAATLGNIPASELERVRTAIMAGEAMGLQWTAMQARKDDTIMRVQVDADYDRVFLFKSIDGGVTWTEIPLGNADTLDGLHANEIASNPNLLINPDFRVNQRGLSEYTSGYTVDRWSLDANKASVSAGTDGISITAAKNITSDTHAFWQWLEFPLPPGKYTLSVNVKGEVTGLWNARIRTVDADGTFVASYYVWPLCTGVNKVSADLPENEHISAVSVGIDSGTKIGDSVKLEWIKLEPGSDATPFCPPDPATELLKCQRYYQRFQGNTVHAGSGFITSSKAAIICAPLSTSMRIRPTVTIHGTTYIWTKGHVGNGAYTSTEFASGATLGSNTIALPMTIDATNDVVGYGAELQFRDSDSYIELSAEL